MTIMTETVHATEFLRSEGCGTISRDVVTIVSGAGVVLAGTVLGKITASGKYTPSPDTGADGSQVAKAVLYRTVDATSADVTGAVIVSRHAEVSAGDLTYHSSVSDATKRAAKATQLAAVSIVVRT